MQTDNPYEAPRGAPDEAVSAGLLRGSIAFMIVLGVAAMAGAMAPSIAHLAGAPNEFTLSLLRISMAACIPLGTVVAYFASRCVRHGSPVSRLCWFFTVLLVVVPLAVYPRTAGPLVQYTGFALVVTVVAALIVSGTMRQVARPGSSRHIVGDGSSTARCQ